MGTAEIVTEQKKATYTPYVRVYCGADHIFTTTDSPNKVISVKLQQEPWKEECQIVLSNYNQALSSIDLRGHQTTLGFGFVINGSPDYINQPPLWVIDQLFDSRPGVLTCTLICQGIMSCINDDKSSAEWVAYYNEDDDIGDEINTLIASILEATTIPSYTHCTAYILDWTGVTLATDVNLYHPGAGFTVSVNSNRLEVLRRLMETTWAYPRPANDGKIYFVKPTISGEVYDYEYDLTTAGAHKFWIKKQSNRIIIPNYVRIYGGEWVEDPVTEEYDWEFTGFASDDDSMSHYKSVKTFEVVPTLISNDECTAYAAALLSNYKLNRKVCVASTPFNCTAKILDYIKITDQRQGDSVVGNIGRLIRRFQSGAFSMEVQFGGWLMSRTLDKILSSYRKRPYDASLRKWITISCPDIYLTQNDYIYLQQFVATESKELVIKAFNIFGQGDTSVKLQILVNDGVIFEKSANETEIYWSEQSLSEVVENDVITFKIINGSKISRYCNGFILYCLV